MARFSDTLMDHFESPRNMGAMEAPDHVGLGSLGGQWPYVTLHLRVTDKKVCEAKFQAAGCGVTIAAASMLTELITGRTLSDCLNLCANDVSEALGGVPSDKQYCVAVALSALQSALKDL